MDETGQSGDTGPAESGTGADSRDRALLNGWATSDSAWSNAGSALDPEEDVPAWRRPASEVRPFTRQNFPPERGPDGSRPFGTQNQSGEVRPFGSPPNPFADSSRSGEVRPFPDGGRSGEVRPFPGAAAPGEVRPFSDASRSGEIHSFGDASRSGEVRSYGTESDARPYAAEARPFGDGSRSGEVSRPEPPAQDGPAPQWSNSRNRYADLLHHFAPAGEPTGAPDTPAAQTPAAQTPFAQSPAAQSPFAQTPFAQTPPAPSRPDSLEDDDRRAMLSPLDAPPPSSAPPYPYEGDLDDDRRAASPVAQQRAAVPLERPQRAFPAVRPATPGGRRVDWSVAESARHALDPVPPPDDTPPPDGRAPADQETGSAEPARVRPSYDPVSFPRRLPYTPPRQAGSASPADTSTGYVAPTAFSGFTGRSVGDPAGSPAGEQTARALPKRVPAEPDVPTVPEPPSVEPPAETPALARIATHLRRGDVLSSQERQEGFDVKAILAAVREVDGVRDASLRSTPAGAHSLRLDLAEGADPAEVSRQVARLLQDRMGLDAAMQGGETAAARSQSAPTAAQPVIGSGPANTPPTSAFLPTQAGPSGRASVPSRDDLRRLPTTPQAGPGPMTVDETPIRPVSSLPVSPAPIPAARIPEAQISPAHFPQAQISPAAPVASAGTGTASVAGPATADPAEGRSGTVETVSSGLDCGPPRPLDVREQPGPRVVIENVQVNTFGTEATVEVRLGVGSRTAAGLASGPAVDGYLLRLCAMATTAAVDELLAASDHTDGPARCFVEHAASVPFGGMQVAVVVLLLSCGGNWVEQLAGSAVVSGDDRHAMVRATLAAVNRRLEALLS